MGAVFVGIQTIIAGVSVYVLRPVDAESVIKKTVYKVRNSTAGEKKIDYYIKRDIQDALKQEILGRRDLGFYNTCVAVMGAKGVGKSTLAVTALSEETGVSLTKSRGVDEEKLASAILSSVSVQLGALPDPMQNLVKLLEATNQATPQKPIIIVDVRGSLTKANVKCILDLCKDIGTERELAVFVPIFSSSSVGYDFNMEAERCQVFNVREPNTNEIREHCKLIYNDYHIFQVIKGEEEIAEGKKHKKIWMRLSISLLTN